MNVRGWSTLGFASDPVEVLAVDSQPGHVDVTVGGRDVDVVGVVPTTAPTSHLTLTGVSSAGSTMSVDYSNILPPPAPSGGATYDPPPPTPDGSATPI